MTDGLTAPTPAGEPAPDDATGGEPGREPGPRDVRVSVVGDHPGGPRPIVLGPGARPAAIELDMLDIERAVLRDGEGGEAHRVLLLPAQLAQASVAAAMVRSEVVIGGWRVEVDVEPAARAALRDRARRGREDVEHSGPARVHAIIPGVVVSVSVAPGDTVEAGQHLLVVEAMKMQNELRAPRAGTIDQVAVGAGVKIEVGDLLVVIA